MLRFDEAQSKEAPESFIERVLIDGLAVKVVVVGQDFHFGSHRDGNVRLLEEYGVDHDFVVEPVDLVVRATTASRSRSAARRSGARSPAARSSSPPACSGRPHEVRGTVVQGDKRGRLIGFPTANVEVPNSVCLPADGVYAGRYERPDGTVYPCAINLGRRPTFYEHADHSLLEAHLLDFDGDLYGEQAEVRFEHFLRSERKFDGIEAIRAQLVHDVEHARELLA